MEGQAGLVCEGLDSRAGWWEDGEVRWEMDRGGQWRGCEERESELVDGWKDG